MNDLTCPFCKEGGMDDIGLKGHLLSWCEVFDNTPLPFSDEDRERQRKRLEEEE